MLLHSGQFILDSKIKSRVSPEVFEQLKLEQKRTLEEIRTRTCPICSTSLKLSLSTRKYETLEDHVFDPCGDPPDRLYLICPNESCSLHADSFWDFYGEFYTSKYREELEAIFNVPPNSRYNSTPTQCFAAGNSPARKAWFEIYYKIETRRLFIGRWGGYISWRITATEAGEITRKIPKVILLKKEPDGMRIQYVPGLHKFFFSIKSARRIVARYKLHKSSSDLRDIRNECDPTYWTNKGEWWRVAACTVNRLLYSKYVSKEGAQ